MADNCSISLLEAMDCLWFDQIVLHSARNSLPIHKTFQTAIQSSETLPYSSSNTSELFLSEEEISSTTSALTSSEVDSNYQHDDADEQKKEIKSNLKQPTRFNPITSKPRSRSSSLSNRYQKKRLRSYTGSVMRLQKTMSSKTLAELELEEVKGFIDLGFEFSKENLSPRMMSVVPGLQRFGSWDMNHEDSNGPWNCDLVEEETEEERGVLRPYLSEAWIMNIPESPLVNIRLPSVSAAADMKKHIKCWARTVAAMIRYES